MKAPHLFVYEAPEEALEKLRKDPVLAPLVARHGRARWGVHGVFPALVRAVAGQQVSNQAAKKIFERLYRATGADPERVLALEEAGLRELGVSRAKARTLLALAEAARAGAFSDLASLSDEAVRERLLAFKGVGPWTVDMVLIFGLGREDVWPASDLGLVQQAMRHFGLKSREAVARLGTRFRPYRSVAAHYLWAENDA